MTYREIELYLEGQDEWRSWLLEALAWAQSNLINVHVPRGKPKVRPEQLLPKKQRKRKAALGEDDRAVVEQVDAAFAPLSETPANARARVEAAKARAREKREREEWDEFRKSNGGRRIAEIFDDER